MRLGTAATGAMMAAAGLSFAQAGWQGVKRPRSVDALQEPDAAAAPPASPPSRSTGALLLSIFFLLFGIFAAGCGVLLLIGGLFLLRS